MNSERVFGSRSNSPRIELVMAKAFCWATPRIIMHRWIASTTTASDGSYQVTFRTGSGSILRVAVLSQLEDASMPVTVRNNRTEKLILSMESTNMSLGGEPTQDLSCKPCNGFEARGRHQAC